MFPIGDTEQRNAGPGFLTIGLVVLNVIVFIFQITMSDAALNDFIRRWGVIPVEILEGDQLLSLFTSMFLHGGWMHLISNMLYLWVFGDNIEHVLGELLYLAFYFAGGLAASAAHILLNSGSSVPSVGASGAIAAILGAYIVMFPESRVKVLLFTGRGMGVRRVTALIFLGIWGLSQLLSGIGSLGAETAQTGGVAVWAHIGGFVFGLIIGFLAKGRAGNLQFES
jgi:membrane associated rhomboid family serine protease